VSDHLEIELDDRFSAQKVSQLQHKLDSFPLDISWVRRAYHSPRLHVDNYCQPHIRICYGSPDANGVDVRGLGRGSEHGRPVELVVGRFSVSLLAWAIKAVMLDPFLTATLRAEDVPSFSLPEWTAFYQANFRRYLASFGQRRKGRILWIDCNLFEETIVDCYGINILSSVASQLGFMSRVVSPFIDFADGPAELKNAIDEFAPHLICLSIRNFDSATILDLNLKGKSYLDQIRDVCNQSLRSFKGPVVVGGSAPHFPSSMTFSHLPLPVTCYISAC
jgi:hypothetical protein